MSKIQKISLILFLLITVTKVGIDIFLDKNFFTYTKEEINVTTKTTIKEENENIKIKTLINKLSSSENKEIGKSLDLIESWDFRESIKIIEELVENNDIKSNNDTLTWLNLLLIHSYLNYWSVYYDEAPNAQKARALLDSIKISKDSWYYSFYMGYSYEIEDKFNEALTFYNKALIFSTTKKLESKTENQIWHIYDLDWYIEKAYEHYLKSLNLDKTNTQAKLNLARTLSRQQKYPEAIKYFEEILSETKDNFLKAEINFNLATIYMYKKWDTAKNYQASINYAQKAIDTNPEYPLWHVWVARILIRLDINLEHAGKLLEESIKLNPNLSSAYEWLWKLKQTEGDFKKSIEYFEKSIEVAKKDITLMRSEANSAKWTLNYYIATSYALLWDKDNTLKYLNEFLKYPNTLPLLFLKKESEEKDYWVFSLLKENEEFENILKGKRKK